MVLAGFVGGFGWFWLVPCFSDYEVILYKICSSVFFLHARHSVLVLSQIVL